MERVDIDSSSGAIKPNRSLYVISLAGLARLEPFEITPENVGLKAFGLSALPSVWTLPFFLLDASCAAGDSVGAQVESWVSNCLEASGISPVAPLILRSSGTSETLSQRGRLHSQRCTRERLVVTLRELIEQTAQLGIDGVYWIVQEYISPRVSGHFSNERRVSYESRDWMVEVERRDASSGYNSRVAVRKWRDGTRVTVSPLRCSSEAGISICLKQVAMWALQFSRRMHFEWLWDGSRVWLLQVDVEGPSSGVEPPKVLPLSIPALHVAGLAAFRSASQEDYSTFPKLRNASIYQRIGYEMPPFYVLVGTELMASIVNGKVPIDVRRDLDMLTVRPLIIRTDGLDIPPEKREMLPRSDELRSAEDAVGWLEGFFYESVKKANLENSSLILIAHHFIPSVSSAWVRAEPGQDIVRIESLWGIPEGLYWFSHDTFEVNTQVGEFSVGSRSPKVLPYTKKLRYKGTFVAPDYAGKWTCQRVKAPFDWRRSIRRTSWLAEIAWYTRQVAEIEKFPVSVMWFIDNHPGATKHRVLPWFHSKSKWGGAPKAAPRRKFRGSSDFRIATSNDWAALKEEVAKGKQVERVVVEPIESSLIRDGEFASELGALAKVTNCVVELSGGLLSHAYYILDRIGARVECVDLFGDVEEVVEFNKVVRDKIPAAISRKGERAQTIQLGGDALVMALKQKLVEEAFEALDAVSGEELIGELADVLEVIRGLSGALGIDMDRIEADRKEKRRKKGGFDGGFMLTKTITPHTIPQLSQSKEREGEILVDSSRSIIFDPNLLPMRSIYRRPDLRQADEREVEKILTIEADVNRLKELREALEFSFPDQDGSRQEFSLVLELKRSRGALRAIVRVRHSGTQLSLGLEEEQLPLFSSRERKTEEES